MNNPQMSVTRTRRHTVTAKAPTDVRFNQISFFMFSSECELCYQFMCDLIQLMSLPHPRSLRFSFMMVPRRIIVWRYCSSFSGNCVFNLYSTSSFITNMIFKGAILRTTHLLKASSSFELPGRHNWNSI